MLSFKFYIVSVMVFPAVWVDSFPANKNYFTFTAGRNLDL